MSAIRLAAAPQKGELTWTSSGDLHSFVTLFTGKIHMKHKMAVASFLAATMLPAVAADISGAGATFPHQKFL